MRQTMVLTCLLLTLGVSQGLSHGGTPKTAKETAHLLIQVRKTLQGFQIVHVTRVEAPLPKHRGVVRSQPWRLHLVDKQGKIVFQVGLPDPSQVRGEFLDPSDPERIQAHHIKLGLPIDFVVRVPATAAHSLDFFQVKPEFRGSARYPANGLIRLGSATLPVRGSKP